MATQGGKVEQKDIGINISTDGTFSNTELVNGKIQLKPVGTNPTIYPSIGFWTSKVIDIGDNFKEYGKVIITQMSQDNSNVTISTRSSTDGVNFNLWVATKPDGTIMSPKNRFTQIRLELHAGTTLVSIKLQNTDILGNNKYTENTIVETSGYKTPTLTSATSSTEGFSFASSEYSSGYASWKAFDKLDKAEGFVTINGTKTGFLGFCFSRPIVIAQYKLRSMSSTSYLTAMPKDWVIQASNDTTDGKNGTWITLDTQANQVWTTVITDKVFKFKNDNAYIAYRINFSTNNGYANYTGIGQMDFATEDIVAMQLKHNYNESMSKDATWSEIGSLYRKKIKRNEWVKIDKIEVL